MTSFTGAINGPNRIALGPYGILWYTNWVGWAIGRITTKGVSTSFTAPGVALRLLVGADLNYLYAVHANRQESRPKSR